MKLYNARVPLLSIHVPKCGGTSLTKVLSQWFGKGLHHHYFDEKNQRMPKRVRIKRFLLNTYLPDICIHGHFNKKRGFGVMDYYPEVDQAITFLRDPLEVQLSLFFYNHKLKEAGNLTRDGKPMEITSDIDEFLETSNPYFKLFFPDKLNPENMDWYFENYFIHVGIMEEYQKSLDILAQKLAKPKVIVSLENRSARFAIPSDLAVTKFKEKCSFEYKFYERALKEH